MALARINLDQIKTVDNKGYRCELAHSKEKGWYIVKLSWFQRCVLRQKLSEETLRSWGFDAIANSRFSYLDRVLCNEKTLDRVTRKKVNTIFKTSIFEIESIAPKGIMRKGHTCYMSAFLQGIFAIKEKASNEKLKSLFDQYQTMDEEQFFEEVLKLRQSLFDDGNIQELEGMQDLQDLIPSLMKMLEIEKMVKTNGRPIHKVDLLNVFADETLPEAAVLKLSGMKVDKMPRILPVTVSDTADGKPTLIKADPEKKLQFGGKTYELRSGIINRLKHFQAVVQREDEWYLCDDLYVKQVDPSALNSATTFFYEAID